MVATLSGYRRPWFKFDLLAGLTTAAVVIPKATACAVIAGLPAESGLYVALVPMFFYALLGSSRQLSVSSTTTLPILTGTQLAMEAPEGDPARLMASASTLAMLTGAFLLLAGVLRLGFLASFMSAPVLSGFKAGIGLVILSDQLPKLLGIHINRAGFFRDILSLPGHLPEARVPTEVVDHNGT